jgi:UDP-N-acetylmuramoyl-tripeptide--D-alanyl-D-alanine ligase
MISKIFSIYRPQYLRTIVYMLQSTEYQVGPYLKWYWRTQNFSTIMQRRDLQPTRAARYLLFAMRVGISVEIVLGLLLIYLDYRNILTGGLEFGFALIVIYPVLWAHLIVLPLLAGRTFVTEPEAHRLRKQADKIFAEHSAIKIAVAGSYGKTTMKELLKSVLSEGFNVAATPANKNVAVSHAQFAKKLNGDEDIIIIEYGEGAPGDVKKFTHNTHPTHAVITGLAPAHLDQYKTLQAAGADIFSVADYVEDDNVYVNDESESIQPFMKKKFHVFDGKGALGWKTENIAVAIDGTSFNLIKKQKILHLQSGLVGQHQVGFLAFVATIALEFGMTDKQVVDALARTVPFEHRMQPYQLAGAWIIDDTYNGNLEGIRAGTQLLASLTADRKIYVTPGLVDQGEETKKVHIEMGHLIAKAKPDMVVLMKNSVSAYIEQGLKAAHFAGELRLEVNPLEFYTNLTHFVAAGDLVVMQNDWPDNYY